MNFPGVGDLVTVHLSGAINASVAVLNVLGGEGALLPTGPFYLFFTGTVAGDTPEFIYVLSKSGNTLTLGADPAGVSFTGRAAIRPDIYAATSHPDTAILELRVVAPHVGTLQAQFDPATGHTHTGGPNDGPQIPNGGIANLAVSTATLAALAVTNAKLAADAVTDVKVAAAAAIAATKLANATLADVDPATVSPTTLKAQLDQVTSQIRRLFGGTNWYDLPFSLRPNALVNGEFSVWQRGTSFLPLAIGTYGPDRWVWQASGTGVINVQRDTDVPAVGANAVNTLYSCKISVATADAAIAAADVYHLVQPVEGYDYQALTRGFSISFWVKGAKTGVHCVNFRSRAGDRSYVAEYTISAANTWEYKTVTVPAPPTAGTWDYANGIGLLVGFLLAAGSTFQTTPGAWQTGNFVGTVNQVNELDSTANIFRVALVNLVPGATPYPLVPVPYQQQIARCERYYELHGLGNASLELATVATGAGQALGGWQRFRVQKGGAPTLTKVGTWTVTACGQPSASAASVDGYSLLTTSTVAGNVLFYTADATQGIIAEWNPV